MNRKLYFVILIFFTQFFNYQYLFGMDPRQVSISASSKGQLIKLLKAEVAQKPKDLSKQTPDNLRQIIQATTIALENQREWNSISQELQIKDAHLENLLHKIQNSAQKALNSASKTTKTPAPIEVAKKTTRPAHVYIPANNQPSDSQPRQMPKAASSVTTEPKAEQAQLSTANEGELAALAEKYKKGFPVQRIPKLQRLYLTPRSVQHVFGIELKKSKNKNEDVYLSGFHHDYNLALNHEPFYVSLHGMGNGFSEGFIAMEKTHSPVYKTFFSHMLSKKQVIDLWVSSLKNIQNIQAEGENRLVIEGITPENVKIKTVIEKNTGEVVTFFPESSRSETEIQSEAATIKGLFKKFFHSKEGKQARAPIAEKEITSLMQLYPDGIPFNMVLAKFNVGLLRSDLNNPELRKRFPQLLEDTDLFRPYPENTTLIREKDIEMLSKRYPGKVIIQGTIKNLYFTAESLKTIFSEVNDANFPPNLTRNEILALVVDALNNINLNPFKIRDNKLFVRAHNTGKGNNERFVFYITIDEKTGNIENFYPLFG